MLTLTITNIADCAIAGGAHYLVSEDKHFQVLKKNSFPKINILSIDDFIQELSNLK
jgi:hypothetical protein